jgi:hypothetical protein
MRNPKRQAKRHSRFAPEANFYETILVAFFSDRHRIVGGMVCDHHFKT